MKKQLLIITLLCSFLSLSAASHAGKDVPPFLYKIIDKKTLPTLKHYSEHQCSSLYPRHEKYPVTFSHYFSGIKSLPQTAFLTKEQYKAIFATVSNADEFLVLEFDTEKLTGAFISKKFSKECEEQFVVYEHTKRDKKSIPLSALTGVVDPNSNFKRKTLTAYLATVSAYAFQ